MVSDMILEKTDAIDLLDRQNFVYDLVQITEVLADNKRSACYALNGDWGVGKTFVLNLYEEQMTCIHTDDTTMSKYLVFHYNCWQYDYYDEPLIAVVAAMRDTIEENVNLFSDEVHSTVEEILKIVGDGLYQKTSQYIEDKTGVDIAKIANILKEGNEAAKKEILKEKAFDSYLAFKKTLKALKAKIKSLAEEQTVLIIVDELDRCLPEYAIKVLERLHHVFDGIPNVQMILSVDKKQLSHTVEQIYGNGTSTDKYLAKFIDFEVSWMKAV